MIPLKIICLAVEVTSGHNDGWAKKIYRERLLQIEQRAGEEIKNYIRRLLHKK